MIIEDEIIGSQSEDESKDANLDAIMSEFGVEKEPTKEKEVVTPAPAIEKAETPKTMKVKHNHEEVEVDISEAKLPEHLQKSLALDKERERKTELEKNLDRAAKLHGYSDHAAYVADLDRLEQEQQNKGKTKFDTMKSDLLDELVANGLDRTKAEEYIESHPLFIEGKKAMEQSNLTASQAKDAERWEPLYKAVPEFREKALKNEWDWYTPELAKLVEKGNEPLIAYEYLNKDKATSQTKKATEQQIIKEQQLGLRSRVETIPSPDHEKQVPAALADAFKAFGLPAEAAKKYVK